MLDSAQLKNLADRFGLSPLELAEAQELLLLHGVKKDQVGTVVLGLCEDARDQGGAVAMFDKLLKGRIAVLQVSQTS